MSTKYILSDIGKGIRITSNKPIILAHAFACDISLSYIALSSPSNKLSFGMAITNLGQKLSYFENRESDFLPTKLSLGSALATNLGLKHSFNFAFDINKLLIPSPKSQFLIDGTQNPEYDLNQDGIADHRQQSVIGSLFSSFGDAQGGTSEELKEFRFGIGVEYLYANMIAARFGSYFENELKGNKHYLTIGSGIRISNFEVNVAYNISLIEYINHYDKSFKVSLRFEIPS